MHIKMKSAVSPTPSLWGMGRGIIGKNDHRKGRWLVQAVMLAIHQFVSGRWQVWEQTRPFLKKSGQEDVLLLFRGPEFMSQNISGCLQPPVMQGLRGPALSSDLWGCYIHNGTHADAHIDKNKSKKETLHVLMFGDRSVTVHRLALVNFFKLVWVFLLPKLWTARFLPF